jgi:hypothetical protein
LSCQLWLHSAILYGQNILANEWINEWVNFWSYKEIFHMLQAKRVFVAGAVLFDLGGNGVFWQKKGVTLRGLRISEKKEILRKLTVFDGGGTSNFRSSLSHCLASIRGPSLLIIVL